MTTSENDSLKSSDEASRDSDSTPLEILGIGNPLLDISANVPTSFVDKYKLQLNNMYLCSKEQYPIYEEMQRLFKTTYTIGGATMNSIRVAQALLKADFLVGFSGSIGNDREATVLENLARELKIYTNYFKSKLNPTGLCAVLINGGDKALCTNLAAANDLPLYHVTGPLLPDVKRAKIIYSAGYFLTVCAEGMVQCGEICAKDNKVYAMNISAVFLLQFFEKQFDMVFPYVDILFGNEAEFLEYAKIKNYGTTDFDVIAEKMLALPKINTRRKRSLVITQGSKAVLVYSQWAGLGVMKSTFPVIPIPSELIVDVNGAGDAFVGGFLAGLARRQSLGNCVYYGIYAATEVLKHSGCDFDLSDVKILDED